jgi:outer membrane protein assembly factor BamB
VGDYKGRIHAIRREDGKADWVYEPERTTFLGFTFGANDRILAPIALGDGELFVGTEHGVYALDISEEKPGEKWSFDTEHSVWAQPLYVNDPELGPPTLFVASLDQHLYALDPDTGRSRWSIDLDGALVGQPTLDVEHSRLYIATLNYEVYAISLDGEEEDSYATRGWVWGSPVLHDSRLYFGDLKGWLYEVEITDEGFGDDWSRQLADGALRAAPIIIEDTLVAASDDQKVYAVNLTDRSVSWEKDVEAPAVTDITWVMHNDEPVVVVGTKEKDTLLVALRLSDGNKEWAYKYDD